MLNPGVEISLSASLLVEGQQSFHCDVGIGDGLAECAAGNRLQDLFCTGKLFAGILRTAHKNTAAACSVSGTGRIERTCNRYVGDAQAERQRVVQIIDASGIPLLDDRDPDRLWSGLHLEPDVARAAPIDQGNSFAVDADFDFFLAANGCLPKTAAGTSDPEVVLGIQGKDVLDEHPTTSAERQTFEVIRLCQAPRDPIRHLVRTDFRIADSEMADLCGRGDITLDEQRRNSENVGDIIKALGRVVAWKKRCCIDRHRKQIADGIRILRPIEAVQSRRPGIRFGCRCMVDCSFEMGCERIGSGAIRPARPSRRHHAGTQFSYDFFPSLRAVAGPLDVHLVEHQPRDFRFFAVARDAVLIEERAVLRDRRSL